MKALKSFFGNWRTYAIVVLTLVSMFLILCDAERVMAFIASKAAGMILALVTVEMAKMWYDDGKLDYIDDISIDE